MVWKRKRGLGRTSQDPEYYFRKLDRQRRAMAEEPKKDIKPKILFSYKMLEQPKTESAEPKPKKKPGRKPKHISKGITNVAQDIVVSFG
jgi:hypothetical protein